MITLLFALAAATATVAITGCGSDQDADRPPPSTRAIGGLPYTAHDAPGRHLPVVRSDGRQHPFTLLDSDGDGDHEMVVNIDQGGEEIGRAHV